MLESWSGAYLGVGMPGLSQAVVQLFLWIFFFFFFFSSTQWSLFSVSASDAQCGLGLRYVL